MADWHFLQGVRGEWRWYRLDAMGRVTREAPGAFDDLEACMADARGSGFRNRRFAVHARSKLPQFPRRRAVDGGAMERRRPLRLRSQTANANAAEERPRSVREGRPTNDIAGRHRADRDG